MENLMDTDTETWFLLQLIQRIMHDFTCNGRSYRMFSINGGGCQDFSNREALGSLGRYGDNKEVLGGRAVCGMHGSERSWGLSCSCSLETLEFCRLRAQELWIWSSCRQLHFVGSSNSFTACIIVLQLTMPGMHQEDPPPCNSGIIGMY